MDDRRYKIENPLLSDDTLLTTNQVARWLGVTSKTLAKWIAQGAFPEGRKFGARKRWIYRELRELLDADWLPGYSYQQAAELIRQRREEAARRG